MDIRTFEENSDVSKMKLGAKQLQADISGEVREKVSPAAVHFFRANLHSKVAQLSWQERQPDVPLKRSAVWLANFVTAIVTLRGVEPFSGAGEMIKKGKEKKLRRGLLKKC